MTQLICKKYKIMEFHLFIETCNEIRNYLNTIGVSHLNRSNREVFMDYFQIKHKMIKATPRNLYKADHLDEKAKQLGLEDILSQVEQKIKVGNDLNPYLSKNILKIGEFDYLLNDWKINHLHLSNNKANPTDYFYTRSNYLLFFTIEDSNVYLIDIRHHNERFVFSQKDFLRIISRNWSTLDEKYAVDGGRKMQIEPNLDEEGIGMLRKKGYHCFTQVDDRVYAPGLGSTCSGNSLQANLEEDDFYRELFKLHNYILENIDEIKNQFQEQLKIKVGELNFTMKLIDHRFYILETTTQQFLYLN